MAVAHVLLVLGLSGPKAAQAGTSVHRCTVGGRVVFQDHPCEVAPAPPGQPGDVRAAAPTTPPAPAGEAGYGTALGAWRGPLQFQFSEGGQRDPAAHMLANVVLELKPDGSVRGASTEAGCSFLGLAGQVMANVHVWTLDLTAKGCADARFDQRYSGTLSVYQGTKVANLRLSAMRMPGLVGKVAMVQLAATLRR
jgi:hypothetical protein